jgi:uncharacterized protein YcfJ
MRPLFPFALTVAALALATAASAQVVFYERNNFEGRSFHTEGPVNDFAHFGFNDRASSVVVQQDRWQLCEDAGFGGRCVVLGAGRYPSLGAIGLNDRISSARAVDGGQPADHRHDDRHDDRPDWRHDGRQDHAPQAYAPPPQSLPEYRRRDHERLFEARVTSVRAVVGTQGQRCWVEREQVSDGRGNQVPATIAGAVIGGIIGHQFGGGFGKDLATAGGVVAGAAVGSHLGAGSDRSSVRPVQHCSGSPGPAHPAYWDVSYRWRGVENRVQMTAAPGRTVTVNRLGEPRE